MSKPSKEQIECHAPKPIIINAGDINSPYPWIPQIVPISIFQIGSSFFILNVPSEFTTMAGRRLKKAVREVLITKGGINDPQITIAGLANSYSHYVTTFEEYANQRYEGACTLYGPHTLAAYIQEFQRITTDLVTDTPSKTVSGPIDLTNQQVSLIPSPGVDFIGVGYEFGSVVKDANDTYRVGDRVKATFRSANPRHNQRIEGTYLTVDKLNESNGIWETLYVDGDWCTEFHWNGGIQYWSQSFVDIVWEIPREVSVGLYRVCHYGTRKTMLGGILSSLFVIPFIWASIKANNRRKSIYLIVSTVILCVMGGNILTNLIVTYIPSASAYEKGFGDDSVAFSPSKFVDLSLVIFVLSRWSKISFDHLTTRIAFNVFACSLAVFYGFLQYPALAYRIYDFMQTFLVILICSLENKKKLLLFLPWILYYSINSILSTMNNDYFYPIRN